MPRQRCWQNRILRKKSGFTLVEVLIAGVVLTMVMSAIGRLTVSALSAGRTQGERTGIEAAISENIQMIQMADSEFRFEAPNSADQPKSSDCTDPASALKTYIEGRTDLDVRLPAISRTYPNSQTVNTLIISYEFEAPEQSIGKEFRILELNPNFQARCP